MAEMKVQGKLVGRWYDSEGVEHRSVAEAADAERRIHLRALADQHCHRGMSDRDIADFIFENRGEVAWILTGDVTAEGEGET